MAGLAFETLCLPVFWGYCLSFFQLLARWISIASVLPGLTFWIGCRSRITQEL